MDKYLTLENAVDAIIKYNPSYSPTVFKYIFERYGKFEDVEPVRHGHWIYKCQNRVGDYNYECSVCERWVRVPIMKDIVTMPYCNCGAKMDKGEDE